MTAEKDVHEPYYDPDAQSSPQILPIEVGIGFEDNIDAKVEPEKLFSNKRRFKKNHPRIYQFISRMQEKGHTVTAKTSAKTGLVLTVFAAGLVVGGGGMIIKELRSRRKNK